MMKCMRSRLLCSFCFKATFHVSVNGGLVLKYSGLNLFFELIPKLLPKHFKSILKHSGEALEHIQEALMSDLWIFGYYNVSSSV